MLRKQSTVKSDSASLCVELLFPCAACPGMCSFLSGTTPELSFLNPSWNLLPSGKCPLLHSEQSWLQTAALITAEITSHCLPWHVPFHTRSVPYLACCLSHLHVAAVQVALCISISTVFALGFPACGCIHCPALNVLSSCSCCPVHFSWGVSQMARITLPPCINHPAYRCSPALLGVQHFFVNAEAFSLPEAVTQYDLGNGSWKKALQNSFSSDLMGFPGQE